MWIFSQTFGLQILPSLLIYTYEKFREFKHTPNFVMHREDNATSKGYCEAWMAWLSG